MLTISNADINPTIKGKRRLYNWLNAVIDSEGKEPGRIDIIVCSDHYLLDLNRRFLNHDYFTDIITFDYSSDSIISGELYISYDRVLDNARKFRISADNELKRVMVHGVLHLCGYKDKSVRDKALMRQKEEEKLNMINYL